MLVNFCIRFFKWRDRRRNELFRSRDQYSFNLIKFRSYDVAKYPQAAKAKIAERERTPYLDYLFNSGGRQYAARFVVAHLINDRSMTSEDHVSRVHPLNVLARYLPHVKIEVVRTCEKIKKVIEYLLIKLFRRFFQLFRTMKLSRLHLRERIRRRRRRSSTTSLYNCCSIRADRSDTDGSANRRRRVPVASVFSAPTVSFPLN